MQKLFQLVEKSLAEFRVRRRESNTIRFLPRHVRGGKHFARSERRIVRYQRTTEAQSAAKLSRKSGKATFSTVSFCVGQSTQTGDRSLNLIKEVPRARRKADGFPSPFREIWVTAPTSSQALYRLRRFFMLCIKNHLALTPLRLLPALNPSVTGLQGGFCLKFGPTQIARFPAQGRHESFFALGSCESRAGCGNKTKKLLTYQGYYVLI